MPRRVIIPSDLNEARELEEQMLREIESEGFGEADLFAIKLALEEGLTNAIKHGNKYSTDKNVRVEYEVSPEEVRVAICDQGCGFLPESVPDPTADENLERPCGRGLMLMRAYMDTISFSECGCCVQMSKRKSDPE